MRRIKQLYESGCWFIRSKKRLLVVLSGLATLVCCAGLAFVSHAYITRERSPMTPPPPLKAAAPSSTVAQKAGQRGPIEVVRFTLYDVGIYPREAHVGKGTVAITIEDLSGGSSGLVVERQAVGLARVSVGSIQRSKDSRGRNDIRLEPGRYEVYMADRPNNRAVLVVEP